MGCGVCEDICPKHCISIRKGRLNIPTVDEEKCINCGLCRKVCAGKGVQIEERANMLFGATPHYNEMLGHYFHLYKGFSKEYNIRFHCASGGCTSHFLIWLLEKGIIDGAVVTGYEKHNPMGPRTYIAHNRDEVLAGKSSKYCVVSMNGIAKEIHNTPGRYVVVGLPCHIHAFRKYCDLDKTVGERIIGFFTIFCSGNKNMDSQAYMLWRYNIDKKDLYEFSYRDEGCMGSVFFRDKSGSPLCNPISYSSFYSGVRAFFSIPRCGVCSDFFGELGDIGFGDLNTNRPDDDPIGINSLITRSDYWDKLLRQCASEGVLWIDDLDENTMIKVNGHCLKKKGDGIYAERNIRNICGLNNPIFDNLTSFRPTFISYIRCFSAIVQRFIGSHRALWPIIKVLDRNKIK